mmetsp:Transcript_24211/g.40566  ORF Transcript_24211/g.40566 Transcript_24211/m.40566 type:complete len:228 (+) Transcript_24211:84-767(+)|eukprot:CAMPEP_0198200000 /NCGR_PEP_ID=MMETSP1445-20131203/3079_1 /TAXON_ID=36898 /ORGANISM="Pyramimonas sp., Strain CCMP2087" /LENGTH=227 /DNA_ID=CAMNT_0043869923 /DNA_START=105 /DNA_END=788 /DNA_ORIENTATION=-
MLGINTLAVRTAGPFSTIPQQRHDATPCSRLRQKTNSTGCPRRALIHVCKADEVTAARRVSSKSNGKDTLVAGILGCAAALSLQACVSLEALAAPCVLTQAGDLEFCEIKVGKGPAVKTGNTVELVYQGTDVNTRDVYDSSPLEEPLEVELGNDEIIPGWEAGIVGGNGMPPMNYGGIRKLIVPAKQAFRGEGYGCRYNDKARGGMKCLVNPGAPVEIVVKVLGKDE